MAETANLNFVGKSRKNAAFKTIFDAS